MYVTLASSIGTACLLLSLNRRYGLAPLPSLSNEKFLTSRFSSVGIVCAITLLRDAPVFFSLLLDRCPTFDSLYRPNSRRLPPLRATVRRCPPPPPQGLRPYLTITYFLSVQCLVQFFRPDRMSTAAIEAHQGCPAFRLRRATLIHSSFSSRRPPCSLRFFLCPASWEMQRQRSDPIPCLLLPTPPSQPGSSFNPPTPSSRLGASLPPSSPFH